ncbi:MAG: NAD-dependent epimerase/dehydratase family protein [Candidatus Andersenbacteria bacterium]
MKILITGGAGFIGAHLARALDQAGHQVTILDDFSALLYSPDLKAARVKYLLPHRSLDLVQRGSILDQARLQQVFTQGKFNAVYHLAAHANPGKSYSFPDLYHQVNVVGTRAVLIAAAAAGVERVIFAGSSSVYNDGQTPFREDQQPLIPQSPYGTSKVLAEEACQQWHSEHDIPLTILRFFSVYGPWGRPDMAPMIFSQRILQGQEILVTQEERQRDFTYIDDVIRGAVAALKLSAGCEIINIGRGEPISLKQLLTLIEIAAGQKAAVAYRSAPPGEMRVTYADISKAKRLLNYQPQVSIKEGVGYLVQWVRQWQDKLPLRPAA